MAGPAAAKLCDVHTVGVRDPKRAAEQVGDPGAVR